MAFSRTGGMIGGDCREGFEAETVGPSVRRSVAVVPFNILSYVEIELGRDGAMRLAPRT
jgi:hypothetical protein